MKKDPGVFFDHILECIDLIENYSEGIVEKEIVEQPFSNGADNHIV